MNWKNLCNSHSKNLFADTQDPGLAHVCEKLKWNSDSIPHNNVLATSGFRNSNTDNTNARGWKPTDNWALRRTMEILPEEGKVITTMPMFILIVSLFSLLSFCWWDLLYKTNVAKSDIIVTLLGVNEATLVLLGNQKAELQIPTSRTPSSRFSIDNVARAFNRDR